MKQFAEDNIRYLQQAHDLLSALPDDAFATPAPVRLGSSIGAHLRHCLDHYDSFLNGLASNAIDYDARQRNPDLETCRTTALAKLDATIAALESASSQADRSLRVKMDCGGEPHAAGAWTQSSARRELQFLISHTVHHYAIIKMILTAGGREATPEFGIAPSTLRYHQGATPCAH